MTRRLLILTLAVALAGAACAPMGPNYARPTVTPPPAYRGVLTTEQAKSIADLPWVEQYKEPELAALIQASIDQNLDLRIAVARIMEFRARAASAKADLGPTLSGVAGAQPRTKISEDDNWLRSLYTLGVAFNWEVDFFGRLRRASEAARNDLLATEDGARAVMASLVGDVAQSWFDLRVTDELIVITERNIKLILQYGLEKETALPNVPSALDLVSNPEDKLLLEGGLAMVRVGRPYLMPPDVPAARVTVMRKAIEDTFKDAGFLADAEGSSLARKLKKFHAVLANAASVQCWHLVKVKDRLRVYPIFEAFNCAGVAVVSDNSLQEKPEE